MEGKLNGNYLRLIPGLCLAEVNTRAMFRGQNELIGEFKMVVGDLISIGA
jgi:hypothetical protein